MTSRLLPLPEVWESLARSPEEQPEGLAPGQRPGFHLPVTLHLTAPSLMKGSLM